MSSEHEPTLAAIEQLAIAQGIPATDADATCVYCQPGRHLELLTHPSARAVWTPRCICGRPVSDPGDRCTARPWSGTPRVRVRPAT